jgi:hypothetical protein
MRSVSSLEPEYAAQLVLDERDPLAGRIAVGARD